ncbi:hypothetical protein HPB49_007442 [Dermacentor silvarum]|uniref:Uncharacterized protein n=1 Tax=Dermacentor silvarum TaxID=543639 RepID=A0ACB8DWP3_DERSI|nr:hypothetical protein HPB49_007442 [Dermacentor silvarum]
MSASGSTQFLVRQRTPAAATGLRVGPASDSIRDSGRSLKCLQSQLAPVSACARALSTSTALQQQPQPATLSALPNHVRAYVEEKQRLCQPSAVHICDGSEAENNHLLDLMLKAGSIVPLPKYRNCYLARTDPADVARVESRTMYVIPFSMGPLGSPLSKIGIQLTDSPYVVASMRIMTRMGSEVLRTLGSGPFIKCLHSVGQPLPMKTPPVNSWPCNPEKTIITHIPDNNEICSFGSGYGGNSLLGKKCFALRLGSILAQREGWLAEHMLILGITNPKGQKKYIVAAFPSACGKTNLAMMTPTLPGYKAECVGDDIAWMKFDEQGVLRAINPEYGFFGVAPGTSMATNPNAMKTIEENTMFTNVAETSDGGFWWEGMPEPSPGIRIKSWRGEENWTRAHGTPAAHPNSRFCTPAGQCPIIDPAWEDPKGVPISAILFGGRRPQGKFFGLAILLTFLPQFPYSESPIGYLPSDGALNLDGLQEPVNMKELFDVNKDFWLQECSEVRKYFDEQLGKELPNEISQELDQLEQRVKAM